MQFPKANICLIVFLFHSWVLIANDIKFEHLTVDDGLSQGIVVDVLQDRMGFMWFATNDGLNRYDGKNFKIYRNFEGQDHGFHNKIVCLHEDKDGIIWMGTFGGGLFKYIVETDSWVNFMHDPSDPESISNDNISVILENDQGLWIGTFNDGLNFMDKETGKFQRIPLSHQNGKDAAYIYSGLIDGNNNIWVGTENDVIIYDPEQKTQLKSPANNYFQDQLGRSTVRALFQDGSGRIWIGSESGLYYYDNTQNAIRLFEYPDRIQRKFIVRSLHEDTDKNLWIGYDGEGVGVYNLANHNFTILESDEDNPHSISNNSVYKIYQSRDGILWLCNYGGGVNILDHKKYKFELYRHIRNDPNSLINNNARTIYEDRNGDIWIGTRDGLELFDRNTKTFRHFQHKKNNPRTISASIVIDILEDSHGNLWVGTFAGGLNLMDRKTGNFKHYLSQQTPNSLSNNNVYKIFEDSYNDVWVGTLSGLNKYNRVDDNFTVYPNIVGIKEIFEDSNGRFYIGSDRGLYLFNRRTTSLDKIWPMNGNIQIYWISENSKGEIMVGTEGAGLLIFNSNLSLNRIISESNYLPNSIIHGVLEDDNQNLWISTNSGLTRLAPDNSVMNFDVSDGLQGREFNSGSALKGSDGKFYFGGTNGLNAFFPDRVNINNYIPNVVITKFRIDGQEVEVNPESLLQKHVIVTDIIKLSPHQTSISFEYSSLNYTNSHKNQYSYIMEGLNETWSEPSTNNFTIFNKIPPGKYVFRVVGSNNDGVWNTEGVSIAVHIRPPFWKSAYAIVMYFFLVTILMLLFKKYTLIGVKEKNRLHLEKMERRKQEELYQMKLTFFTNISHEFRTPLTLIHAPINNLVKEYANDENLQEQLSLIQRNSRRLLNMVNQLMDFRRIERDKFYELKLVKQDIISFIKDVTLAFRQPADEKHLALNFFSEIEKCDTWFSPDAFDKILYNLLSNALKFTPEQGEIGVLVTRFSVPNQNIRKSLFSRKKQTLEFSDFIRIIVKNTGAGIEKEKLSKLFDRFYQAGNADELSGEGSGIGLNLTQSLVQFHLGKISVESSPEEGTRFYVDIPLIAEPFQAKDVNILFETDHTIEPVKTRIRKYFGKPVSIRQKESHSSNHEKKNIVIVDDDFDMLTFLTGFFRDQYNVHTAKNGEEGFELIKDILPDIVIADVMMDKMTGIELCKLIKEDLITNHIPVILLTAKTALEYKVEGFDVGADDYITKPFETELLEARVKNILMLREKLRAKLGKTLSLEPSDDLVISADEKFLKSLVALIEENMDNPEFDVDQIVDQIGMSRAVLYRKIKALTGLTVIDVVKNIRIKKSAIMLRSKKYTISEIATAVGFSDAKYFAKCFKKEYEISPREYMSQADNKLL
jgi:signal transduction histidine kinase/ligand-binding sensor domain-containing protein/DNA-binding response OmpR family regulator